jgi:glyoxalase superfamily protein
MRGRTKQDESTPWKERGDYWGVVIDAPDGPELARFYATLLDWEVAIGGPDYATIHPGNGVVYMGFQTSAGYEPPVWPNVASHQQMMMHIDIEVDDLATAVASAIEMGAREAEFQPQTDVRVMLDPAGHPFCLYT